jgi:hypothetical protein
MRRQPSFAGLIEEKERESAQIDARALPVVGIGILLSGIPVELASLPFGIGWIVLLFGVGTAVTCIFHVLRRRPMKVTSRLGL